MSKSATTPNLLPIMHPLYNLREVCKQSALLEDHLLHPRKRCEDCIRKHFLTLEGLLEEATSLDNKGKWKDLIGSRAEYMRDLQADWIDGVDPVVVAQGLRAMRKELAPECFDVRTMTTESRVASGMGTYVATRYMVRLGYHTCGGRAR